MRLICNILFKVLVIGLIFVNYAYSKDIPKKITGVYSNMHYNKEGGDILGIEIFLVNSAKGYFVMFQSSEGEPVVPVITKATVNGSIIEFILPEGPGYSGKFTGKITIEGMSGSFSEGQVDYTGNRIIKLKKKKSYWQ